MSDASATAVTGLGIVCSIAAEAESFARALRAGNSGICECSGGDPPRFSAPLRHFDLAEALEGAPAGQRSTALRLAGRSPRPVRVALVAALEAWASASLHERPMASDHVGLVVAGHNLTSRYAYDLTPRFQITPEHLTPRFALHALDTDHVATLSHVLGISGEGFTVGGASASGTLGLIAGGRLIECGAVDACLVVGALTELSPMDLSALAAVGAMAVGEPGAPFDAARAGFVPGEGAACLVLESAASAEARGVAAHAVLAGYAQRLASNSLADPSATAEANVMRAAMARAGLAPGAIGYVNTHGTGSPAGDVAEASALRDVFAGSEATPWANASKGLVGHCLTAAGTIEAVATVLQLRDGFLHPNPGLKQPLDCGCRFVGERAVPVRVDAALSNGFGLGGFNACVALTRPLR